MIHSHYEIADQGECFLRAVEASLPVATPQQYYVWQRIHLCRFIPHDLMLCLVAAQPGVPGRVHVLNSVPVPDALQSRLQQAGSAFWDALTALWLQGGRAPTSLSLASPAWAALAEGAGLLQAGFQTLIVHGADEFPGRTPLTLHVFAQHRGATARAVPADQCCVALALWMPTLQVAFNHAFGGVKDDADRERQDLSATRKLLSDREIQVLSAVRTAGSNADIALSLGISPMTVKNHLRNIMRKLGAKSRAQAIAEAMSRRLIV